MVSNGYYDESSKKDSQTKENVAVNANEQQEQARQDKLKAECQALIAVGKRIQAVKNYRIATGCSLREAQRQLGMK